MAVYRDKRSEEYPRYSKRAIDNYRALGLGDSMIEYLDTIYGLDPEWCELFMQYTRAGLYCCEVVPQSTREICACAALAALDKQAQLKQHLLGGVAAGATKEAPLEAVFQSVTYGSFPAVMSSIRTYAETFPEMVKRDRPILSGTIELQERLITHANGRLNLHDEGTFTGTVDGRSGALRIVANAVGDLSAYRGEFTILGGTSGLAGLRGHVTVAGTPAVSGTYSGQVHFEP